LVTYHSKEVAVTPKEFMLLRLFLQDPERVLSRETLLVKVWSIRFQPTRTVDMHMASLRQKFGNDTFETVHGIGYRLARSLSGVKS
jgi:DNA-binding response OmpR family regulator